MNPKRLLRVDLGHLDAKTTRKVLAGCTRLLHCEVRRYALRAKHAPWVDHDDLFAIAQVAALEAYTRFNPDAGMSLNGWIRSIARQRLGEAVRAALDRGSVVRVVEVREDGTTREWWASWVSQVMISLDAPVPRDGPQQRTFHEIIADPGADFEQGVEDRAEIRDMLAALGDLSHREQQVLIAELQGFSGAALGRELGITRQKINADRQGAIRKLQRVLQPQVDAEQPLTRAAVGR